MTIKEAFEKLTATTAAAMKNPFFVMRKLHDAFADIADKIEGGGGGSTVEVTQVVSTGTKIATITVDDTPTDLYAPNVSVVQTVTEGTKIGSVAGTDLFAPNPVIPGDDYTGTDTVIGSWFGTKSVHRVVVTLSEDLAFHGQGTDMPTEVTTAISGCDYVLRCIGLAKNSTLKTSAPISLEYINSKWTGYSSEDWTIDSFVLDYVK